MLVWLCPYTFGYCSEYMHAAQPDAGIAQALEPVAGCMSSEQCI